MLRDRKCCFYLWLLPSLCRFQLFSSAETAYYFGCNRISPKVHPAETKTAFNVRFGAKTEIRSTSSLHS